jgi:NDP-sugar pyrophosphorylase family protein/aminoglycoside/choline kinase family phosphotransferase
MKHPRPTKAVILAAGLATRLRPLTTGMPKACLPVWGRPALHHVLNLLAGWGVREALINLHHQPMAVVDTALAWDGPIRLNFSHEPLQPFGTGGALRHAAWFLDDRPFWLANSDVMADADPEPLLKAFHGPAQPLAALWMVPDAGPRTVALKNGFVSNFAVSKPGAPGTVTFSGIHLLRPEVLDFLPAAPVCTIIRAYLNAMAAGRAIAGVTVPDSYWEDIGILPEYLRAHADILEAWRSGKPGGRLCDPRAESAMRALRRRGVRVDGFCAAGPGARIGRGARLHDCLIGPGAEVAPGAEVSRAALAPGVRVHGPVQGMAVPARVLEGAAGFLDRTGWPAADTTALPLGPRGSDRSFARLLRKGNSAILVHYGRERHENTLYAGHTSFLTSLHIRVPRLLAHDSRARLLLFEDAGNRDLLGALAGATEVQQLALYKPVLALTARLHTLGTAAAHERRLRLVAGFTPRLYRWERLYFAHHFLQRRLGLEPRVTSPILGDLLRLARRLESLPRVLIHRDLQSTNVILKPEGPVLIDYQGMRYGAAAYDLASLLADPYVSLSTSVQLALLEEYRRLAQTPLSEELFWTAAIQRLAQALGAFGKLGATPATAYFARHIPPALAMMHRAVERLGRDHAPHLADLLDDLR